MAVKIGADSTWADICDPREVAFGSVLSKKKDEREAKALQLYKLMLADKDFVTVPEPVPELSTGRLLSMSWLEGQKLSDFENADRDTRNRIAEMLFWTWWGPMNTYGVIHGDPHLGNYQLTGGGSGVNLLDFGCIRIFPARFVGGPGPG